MRYVGAGRRRALRVLSRLGCAAGPAFGSSGRATCSSSLALAPAGSGAVCIFSTAVAAIPGGSSAVLRRRHRGSACCRGCRPGGLRLKTLCPPGVVWLRRLVPRKRPRVTRSRLASHRSPPRSVWSCKGKPRSGSGAAERRSVACGLSAARTRRPAPWPRHAAGGGWRPPPSRVAGNGLSGKRNDRFVTVVIW
nr:Uncharacterised protein [Escherichia coli]